MSTPPTYKYDSTPYTQIDLVTTTLSPIIANICRNQTLSLSDEIENRINVVVPYLVVLGIIGNGFSILTFSQRKLRTLSCGCYLLLLAISDTIALLIISRPYFFKQFNVAHHLNSSILCGLHLFLTKIFDELTPWLLVFVACNRLVLSRFPRNHHCFQTSRSALWSTLFLLIIIIILNIHLLFGIGVGYSPSQPCKSACGPLTKSPTYLFFYKNVSPIIDFFLSLIIPFCIVFIANIFILANVRRVKRRVLRIRRRKRASRNARLSIVLLADLITFLIVSLPVLLVECIYRFTRQIDSNQQFDKYLWIAWLVASKIFYLNYSLSFYFYVLTSSYFRHHFLLAIRCKKLHGFFYQKNKGNKAQQSFQTTDYISKHRTSHLSGSSKILTKTYDFNFLIQPHQSEMTTFVSTAINDTITSHENNHQISEGLSHV
ncbi:unnamed protein product [Adineta steineri]|uniref:G-protein coupled receptors family 1 profile domain-containing protein n=1 Tax=Adineta steineri TaxID=433720 RepID=A0A813WFS9_9BILA|nr:unnamed protein product [Adineta steineri]